MKLRHLVTVSLLMFMASCTIILIVGLWVTPQPLVPIGGSQMCGDAGGSCTAAEVAQHSSPADCWVIYSNGYYDVTSYVTTHPGGQVVFSDRTCGKDITSYLQGAAASSGYEHAHSDAAYAMLQSYYIGPVQ